MNIMHFRPVIAASFLGILLGGAGCSTTVKRPDGGEGLLPIGASAPDFGATTKAGEATRLSTLRGAPVVVYFYPKDETPGCTKEACAFRDAWTKFQTAKVGIVGISRDSEESHRVFVKKHDLPFPLAADENGEIARSYGVKSTLGVSQRVTFLVTADGKIAKIWPDVDPAIHADEVLSAAAAL
ncbi:thioredoxin-dependent thiol peroxidase [soil metagenome]